MGRCQQRARCSTCGATHMEGLLVGVTETAPVRADDEEVEET